MNCSSCASPLAEGAKFCAECGLSRRGIESNALFAPPNSPDSLPDQEQEDAEFSVEPEDEFLKPQEPPSYQPNPPRTPESKAVPELPDLKEPTSEEAIPTPPPILPKDKKKGRKQPPSVRLSWVQGISVLILTLIVLAPNALAVYHYDESLNLRALLSVPFLPLLLWPVLATRGLSLNLVFHLSFGLSSVSFLYLYSVSKSIVDFVPVFLNLQFQGFDIVCTLSLTLLVLTLILFQIIIFYLFRNESILLVKIMLGLAMTYALIEVVQGLGLGRDIPALGGRTNLISHPLTFLGDLALYAAPNYILSNIMLPVFSASFLLGSLIKVFKRNWQLSLSYLIYATLCFLFSLLYLWPYRVGQALGPSDLDDTAIIHSLAPLLQPCYDLLKFLTIAL
jgi:hypothetical protein